MANSAMWANFDALNASITRVVNAVDGQGSASLSVDTMAASVDEFAVGGNPSGKGADVFALQTFVQKLDYALYVHADKTKLLAEQLQDHIAALRSAIAQMQDTELSHVTASDKLAAARVEELFVPDDDATNPNAGGYGDDSDTSGDTDDDSIYV